MPIFPSIDARFIVITSDEHAPPVLERGAWATRPEIRGDFEAAAEAVTDWCEANHQYGIVRISAGDTLDSAEPSPDRLRWLAEYFDQHLQFCKAYYYIQGQHDMASRCPQVSWLSVICRNPKMQYANGNVLEIAGRKFLFHDHTTAATLFGFIEQVLQELDVPDDESATLISHQLWYPWLPASRMYPSLKALPPAITSVFSGDYHVQKDEVITTNFGCNLRAVSIGPFNIQDLSEPPEGRFIVIDTQDWSVQSVPLPRRTVVRVDLQTEDDLATFARYADSLPSTPTHSFERPIIRVAYRTSIENAVKVMVESCENKAHLFSVPIANVEGVNLAQVYRRGNYDDVVQCVNASGMAPQGTRVRDIVDTSLEAKDKKTLMDRLNELRLSSQKT